MPWKVAWFQQELLKVMACKDSLCGRCLHFCLSLGLFQLSGTEPGQLQAGGDGTQSQTKDLPSPSAQHTGT